MKHLLLICLATFVAALTTPALSADQTDPWWAHALTYEIYPRSFADSNGDGVGDLNGITEHLEYLNALGVDAIWIAPMFPSPQVDFGYDISDYRSVDPQFGALADLDRLQAEAKRRGIHLILDLVLNHTSDKHPWFIESASSRENPRADWYVWSDGLPADAPGLAAIQKANAVDGRVPPNNWTSLFGGSAWEWVPARKQFYYHMFYKQQPDLNWRNPEVESAMFDVMRFWMDRGIDGFRLDAIQTIYEDPELRKEPQLESADGSAPPTLDQIIASKIHTVNLPELHGLMRRMRALMDSYPGNRVLIGETYLANIAELDQWYGGAAKDELHQPMNTLIGFGDGATYSAAWFRTAIAQSESGLHGSMPLFVFDNHDNPRSIDRFGDGDHDTAIAKGLAAVLLLPRASALTYYGAEIGMRTNTPKRREDVRDPIGIVGWPREKGRDGERTPMQWTAGPQAGFSSNPKTWLPVNPDRGRVNVAVERADPASLYNWFRHLIALRRTEPALIDGRTVMLDKANPDVLIFARIAAGVRPVIAAMNMSAKPRTIAVDRTAVGKGKLTLLASSDPEAKTEADTLVLPPFATIVVAAEDAPAQH